MRNAWVAALFILFAAGCAQHRDMPTKLSVDALPPDLRTRLADYFPTAELMPPIESWGDGMYTFRMRMAGSGRVAYVRVVDHGDELFALELKPGTP